MYSEPHIISQDYAYSNLAYLHERIGDTSLMLSYEVFMKDNRATVMAIHQQETADDYIFIADYHRDNVWSEMYASTIYPEQKMAKFAVTQAYKEFESNPSDMSVEWGSFQQEYGLVVPNEEDRMAFGAILRALRRSYA